MMASVTNDFVPRATKSLLRRRTAPFVTPSPVAPFPKTAPQVIVKETRSEPVTTKVVAEVAPKADTASEYQQLESYVNAELREITEKYEILRREVETLRSMYSTLRNEVNRKSEPGETQSPFAVNEKRARIIEERRQAMQNKHEDSLFTTGVATEEEQFSAVASEEEEIAASEEEEEITASEEEEEEITASEEEEEIAASEEEEASIASEELSEVETTLTLSKGQTISSVEDITTDVLNQCRVDDMHQICELFDISVPPRAKKAKLRALIESFKRNQ